MVLQLGDRGCQPTPMSPNCNKNITTEKWNTSVAIGGAYRLFGMLKVKSECSASVEKHFFRRLCEPTGKGFIQPPLPFSYAEHRQYHSTVRVRPLPEVSPPTRGVHPVTLGYNDLPDGFGVGCEIQFRFEAMQGVHDARKPASENRPSPCDVRSVDGGCYSAKDASFGKLPLNSRFRYLLSWLYSPKHPARQVTDRRRRAALNSDRHVFSNDGNDCRKTNCGKNVNLNAYCEEPQREKRIDLLHNHFHVFSALSIAQMSFVRNRCLRRRLR